MSRIVMMCCRKGVAVRPFKEITRSARHLHLQINALGREQVERPAVLHRPARVGELSVDEHTGAGLCGNAVGVVPAVHDASEVIGVRRHLWADR
jgi:hypothetical protein